MTRVSAGAPASSARRPARLASEKGPSMPLNPTFMPAAQIGFLRPSVSVAYQPAGSARSPRAQAETVLRGLRAEASGLVVLEQGPLSVGALEASRQEMIFRQGPTPLYAATSTSRTATARCCWR
jgi:hypothetical protein